MIGVESFCKGTTGLGGGSVDFLFSSLKLRPGTKIFHTTGMRRWGLVGMGEFVLNLAGG